MSEHDVSVRFALNARGFHVHEGDKHIIIPPHLFAAAIRELARGIDEGESNGR